MSNFNTAHVANGQIVLDPDDDTLSIPDPAPAAGQNPNVQALGVIQGFNLGDGFGIYATYSGLGGKQISGFKSLVGGTGTVLTTDETTITITSNFTDVLGELSFDTIGGGPSIFAQKIAGDVQLRSILGQGIVAVQQTSDAILVSAAAVTSVGVTGSNDILVTGSPVTSTGTIAVSLSDTGVQAGTYTLPSLTVDSKGRLTAISSGTVVTPTVQAGSGVTVTPGPNYTVGLTSTGVSPGAYVAPSLMIDATGRVTAATSNVIPGPVTAISLGAGSPIFTTIANQQISFRSIVGSGSISVSQDANTIIISAPTAGTVTSVAATGSNGILVTGGPISTSGTLTVALTNTTVTAGTYTAPSITVDATGRITAASSNTLGEANTVSNLTGGYGLFSAKNGVDLQFRSLVSGTGVAISSTTNNVQIGLAPKTCGTSLMAGGSTQATALVLSNDFNEVLTANPDGTGGVILPSTVGSQVFVVNYSGYTISLYPPVGASINALAANAFYQVPNNTSVVARILSSTKIYI